MPPRRSSAFAVPCACVCVCVRVRVRVHVRVRVGVGVRVRMHVRACLCVRVGACVWSWDRVSVHESLFPVRVRYSTHNITQVLLSQYQRYCPA